MRDFVVVEIKLLLVCAGLQVVESMRCLRVYRRIIVKHFGSQLFTCSAVNY